MIPTQKTVAKIIASIDAKVRKAYAKQSETWERRGSWTMRFPMGWKVIQGVDDPNGITIILDEYGTVRSTLCEFFNLTELEVYEDMIPARYRTNPWTDYCRYMSDYRIDISFPKETDF